jgi:sulfide dehydrogenase [flavocytochrome c] flavoprotein subunit
MIKRRSFLAGIAGAGLLSSVGCGAPYSLKNTSISSAKARVVVVGGGFAGLSAARTLKSLSPSLDVVRVEPKTEYIACPFSNLVVVGERQISDQVFGYAAAKAQGIRHFPLYANQIDPVARRVELSDGTSLDYDRLILAPGISFNYEAIDGYSEAAAKLMPHAWEAGEQTILLREQLSSMQDGGTVAIVAPPNPYRCPPGPYERASLIAHYLKRHKPRSKVLVLDAKDRFSKQGLFQSAWRSEYGDMIEWQGLSDGANVIGVDPVKNLIKTDFDEYKVDVANVIPPQRAGKIAIDSGLANESGWCPVEALTFESLIAPNIHVIGDAAILNQMPKSAFSANAQAKLCAVQVVGALAGEAPVSSKLLNTCYSLVNPEYGISVAGVYEAAGERWLDVAGAGGVSPLNASAAIRRSEAIYAEGWFETITNEVFL